MTPSDIIALSVGGLSLLIAVAALVVSLHAVAEQRRVTKWTTNYGRLMDAEMSFKDHPRLLALHGVTDEMLVRCGASPEEVAYLLISFRAGQESWRLDPKGENILSPYRRHMLLQPKVVAIWQQIIHNRLLFRTGFVEMINRFISESEPERAMIARFSDAATSLSTTAAPSTPATVEVHPEQREADPPPQ